eukprot:gnl/MRDRNA2_/MRDRNA2_222248_c0_seq1.p1 gnl/MRDRNA2_/MRDRNA2_222248_c0~~gnl/MRDRNA2_/MRDRNA2_222248_c0_seq1.p1  ORF type:complete len:346 (-),score=39.44 gnl/MRDRNA2_/MRDRNA2_222248_c0_seq1:278-1315(-)
MERSLQIGHVHIENDVEHQNCLSDMQRSVHVYTAAAAEGEGWSPLSGVKAMTLSRESKDSVNATEVYTSSSSDDEGVEACPSTVDVSWRGMLLRSTAVLLAFLLAWMVYVLFSQSGEERQPVAPSPVHLPLHFLKPWLPTSDKECLWDYRRARCKFREVCHYHYHFGDMDLSRSCRLKSSDSVSEGEALPTTDKGCLWDYRRVQCRFREVCHYHYHFGDMDLGASCRLKSSNASSQEGGKCLGSVDSAIVSKPGFSEELDQVGRASFSVWQRKVKTEESLKRHMKLGLSEGCASCYVDVSVCTTSHCLGLIVMFGHDSSQSWECFEDHKCLDKLARCTGLPSRGS